MLASLHFVNFTLMDLHKIIDVDMKVIIKLNEIHGRFSGTLANDFSCLLYTISFVVLHTFVCQEIPSYLRGHLYWKTFWHDVEVAFNVVNQIVVKVQDQIFLIGNIEPGIPGRQLIRTTPFHSSIELNMMCRLPSI